MNGTTSLHRLIPDSLVVGEEQDLRRLRKFDQGLQRSHRSLIIEMNEDIIKQKRHGFGARRKPMLQRSEDQCQMELVHGTFRQ